MVYGQATEMLESRFLRFSNEGMSGSRKYRVQGWQYIEELGYAQLGLPVLDEMWSIYLPYLTVCDISCQEYGPDYAEVSVEYSSDGRYSTDFLRTELSTELNDMGFGIGWTWQQTGYPVEQNESYPIPSGRYIVRMKVSDFDKAKIMSGMNCVNSSTWHGFPAETLLFTGASTSASYSTTGTVTGVETMYTFEFKRFSHNLRYRQPVFVKDKRGQVYYYHSDQNATGVWAQYYVLPNDPRLYTPVLAHTGGWDKPVITTVDPVTGTSGTVYLHTPINFTTALDIPDIVFGGGGNVNQG